MSDKLSEGQANVPLSEEQMQNRLEELGSMLDDEQPIEEEVEGDDDDDLGPDDSQEESEESEEEQEEEQEEEEQEETPEQVMYEVTIEGQTHQVSEEELIRSFEFRGMTTQRRQREAEIHKQAMSELMEEKQQVSDKLQLLDNALAQTTPDTFDFEAIKDLPQEQQQAAIQEWGQRRAMRSEIEKEQEEIAEEQRVAYDRAMRARQQEERLQLLQAIPEWQDGDKFRSELRDISSFASTHLGFPTEEQKMIFQDHRSIIALRYAKLGYEASKGLDQIKKNVKKVVKVKPGAKERRSPDRSVKDKKRIEALKARMQQGDTDAAHQYFEATRGPEFFA